MRRPPARSIPRLPLVLLGLAMVACQAAEPGATADAELPTATAPASTPAISMQASAERPPLLPSGESAYPVVVPAEVAAREQLPWCGHEVAVREQAGDRLDATVRECFLDAYGTDAPAEFVSDAPTVEGARWRTIYRSLGDGTVEVYSDSSADPLSSRSWSRMRCERLAPSGTDQHGTPRFLHEDCTAEEIVSDGSAPEDPTADELALVERLAVFARDPSAEGLRALPFAGEVALGLADRVVVTRPRDELADPDAWWLEWDAFRGHVGPFSALHRLGTWDESPGGPIVRELQVSVGDHPHCASPPVAAPPDLAELRRVSVQPVGIDSCLQWWTVDLFITPDGSIAGVTLDLYEP